MSKIKLLLDVIADVRSLADSLQVVADAMGKDGSADVVEPVAPKKETKKITKKEIKFEDVRGVLAQKSQAGMTSGVHDLIKRYGAKRLSEVDTKHYAAILKGAEELKNE